MSKFYVEATLILGWHSKQFCSYMLWSLRDCNLDNDVEKIAVFQRRKNVILSTLNQRQNLT